MVSVSSLINSAKRTDSEDFLKLICQTKKTFSTEDYNVQHLQIKGRLTQVPSAGQATVVGDIHGDLASLSHILTETEFIEKASAGNEVFLIFLGDYGDRGSHSPEIYHIVFSLKNLFPERVVLIMGNHEGPEDIMAYPHDLPHDLQRKFGNKGDIIYKEIVRLLKDFQIAAIVEKRYVMLHGGVPSKAKSIRDIAYAYEKHPQKSYLEEILWNDPSEDFTGTCASPRGAGRLFGRDITESFLRSMKTQILIRGHEPSKEGYKINHDGRILTLFSRKGPPYFNLHAAYLTFDLSEIFNSANQLEPFIRKF